MRPINAGLKGWLSYFNLKQQGQNPDAAADFIQPTMNIQPFYQWSNEQQQVAATTQSAATSNSSIAIIGVPLNKLWLIHSLTLSAQTLATQYVRMWAAYLVPEAAGNYLQITPECSSDPANGAALSSVFSTYYANHQNPLIIAPGSGLGLQWYGVGAGNITFSMIVRYREVEV